MTLTICPMRAEDLDAVAVLEKTGGDVGWSRAQFEQELVLPLSRFLVLREGINILGYGGFWKVEDEAQVTNIVIQPGLRRQGHGRRLLEALIDQARKESCRFITLEVRSQNVAAQAMYAKAGFISRSRRPQTYTQPVDDALLMEKLL